MNQMIKKIAFAAMLLVGALGIKAEDVLFWQVDESTLVDGIAISTWLAVSPYVEDYDHYVAARVKTVNGNSSQILNIQFPEWTDPDTGEHHQAGWEDGSWGVWLTDDGGGHWGAYWNQSSTGYKTWLTTTDDPATTHLDDLAALDVRFVMELGYNSWSDGANDYVWQTIAASDPELYSELRNPHMYGQGTIDPLYATPWHPNLFTNPNVPEPDSFVLVLLGFGLLMLLRKIERKE